MMAKLKDGNSKKPASERKLPVTYGMLIWIFLFMIVAWLALTVFGGPLSIIGWLVGINPMLITITIIIICFMFILFLRGSVRGATR